MEREICPGCPHSQEIENSCLFRLIQYINLLETGCPVKRHELTDPEWLLVGRIKSEFRRLSVEDAKERVKNNTREINLNGKRQR